MKYKTAQDVRMLILAFMILLVAQIAQSIENPDRLMFKMQSFPLHVELMIERGN